MYRLLYQNLMGNANRKATVDTYKKRERNSNKTLKMVIKLQQKRTKEGDKKRPRKKQNN